MDNFEELCHKCDYRSENVPIHMHTNRHIIYPTICTVQHKNTQSSCSLHEHQLHEIQHVKFDNKIWNSLALFCMRANSALVRSAPIPYLNGVYKLVGDKFSRLSTQSYTRAKVRWYAKRFYSVNPTCNPSILHLRMHYAYAMLVHCSPDEELFAERTTEGPLIHAIS